ncbi:MAG: hypothetical protein ACYC3I_26975 [Gemmataceae bacterium]
MYPILRRILIVTVLLVAYLAALVVYLVPYAWLVSAVLGIVILCRRTYRYTAYGTARWADASDIPHLLEGNGLMVGHIEGKPSKIVGVQALFDSRLSAKAACQKFLMAFQRKPPKFLVRLTKAVHTAIFATLFARMVRAAYGFNGGTDSFRAATKYITEHLMKMPPQRRRLLEASVRGVFMGWLMS